MESETRPFGILPKLRSVRGEELVPGRPARRTDTGAARYRMFGLRNLHEIPGLDRMSPEHVHAIEVVGRVLPFKTNAYVCGLVDWNAAPDDPIFRLTFPQADMLEPGDFARLSRLMRSGAGDAAIAATAHAIRRRLNPHPSGQLERNVPTLGGTPLAGMQRKYRETVLFFPAQGQTCHAYCTYCFRWPQFVEGGDLRFAARGVDRLVAYLRANPEVTDVLFTGGDPLVMRADVLGAYLEPLLDPEFERVNLRIGTKAPAYWPYRFTHAPDADALARLFERVVAAGRHLAVMAHYTHPRELSTAAAAAALRRVRDTGAVVRCQAPIVRRVNDDSETLAALWRAEVHHGAVPYYAFVERDTGARRYFELPLSRALDVFQGAFRRVSGLGRTVAGPVMSAEPGKVLVDGEAEIAGVPVFVLKMLQARDPERAGRVFFARYDERATWFDDLRPAAGSDPEWFPHLAPPALERPRLTSVAGT